MKTYVVKGTSMTPLLKEGQVCFIVEDANEFFAGDVACIERFDRKVIHRLIVYKNLFGKKIIIEKGDSYPIASMVDEEDLMGKCINIGEQAAYKPQSSIKVFFLYILIKNADLLICLFRKLKRESTILKLNYIKYFVIPTVLFNTDRFRDWYRELKVSYSVYRKYNRFKAIRNLSFNK